MRGFHLVGIAISLMINLLIEYEPNMQIESLDQLNDKLNVFLGAYNEIEKLNQMDLVFFKVCNADRSTVEWTDGADAGARADTRMHAHLK